MRKNNALRRSIRILKSFSMESPQLGITDIATKLGLAKSVVHGDVAVLTEESILARNGTMGKYSLGAEIIRLGQVFMRNNTLRQISLPVMERLSGILQETIYLGAWINSRAYCVEIINSPHPLKVTLNIGDEFSLYAGGGGKALLAFIPDEERERILRRLRLIKLTKRTITSLSELRRQLEEVRKKGYGIAVEERYLDVVTIGVPIFGINGRVTACLCAAGPVLRFRRNRILDVVEVLKEAADDILSRLGVPT
jgi:DNA-binding IclR family transcriptional regulator